MTRDDRPPTDKDWVTLAGKQWSLRRRRRPLAFSVDITLTDNLLIDRSRYHCNMIPTPRREVTVRCRSTLLSWSSSAVRILCCGGRMCFHVGCDGGKPNRLYIEQSNSWATTIYILTMTRHWTQIDTCVSNGANRWCSDATTHLPPKLPSHTNSHAWSRRLQACQRQLWLKTWFVAIKYIFPLNTPLRRFNRNAHVWLFI